MAAPRLLRTLSVEHRALPCVRPFDEVHRALIDPVPALKPEVSEILVQGQEARPRFRARKSQSFGNSRRAMAAFSTGADGQTSKGMQYEIGNPLTAERMTRHALAAGLYAPLRVMLYEDESGKARNCARWLFVSRSRHSGSSVTAAHTTGVSARGSHP